MARTPRVKLSVGASGAVKGLTVIVAVIMLAVSGFVGLVAYGLTYGAQTIITSSLDDGPWHLDDEGKLVQGPGQTEATGFTLALGIGGAACSLIVALVGLYLMLRVVRTGAWLEGSVLCVRGALRTKRRDLATTVVSGGSRLRSGDDRSVQKVEVIMAADPGSSRKIVLPLRGAGLAMLPAEELRMLANAITNHRTRSGPDDGAFLLAEHLRRLAADPFS